MIKTLRFIIILSGMFMSCNSEYSIFTKPSFLSVNSNESQRNEYFASEITNFWLEDSIAVNGVRKIIGEALHRNKMLIGLSEFEILKYLGQPHETEAFDKDNCFRLEYNIFRAKGTEIRQTGNEFLYIFIDNRDKTVISTIIRYKCG